MCEGLGFQGIPFRASKALEDTFSRYCIPGNPQRLPRYSRRCHSYLTNVRDLASYWQKEQVDLLDRAIEQLDQFMALLEAGKG